MGNPSPLWPHGDGGLDDLGLGDGVAPVWWVSCCGSPGLGQCWMVMEGNMVCRCDLS